MGDKKSSRKVLYTCFFYVTLIFLFPHGKDIAAVRYIRRIELTGFKSFAESTEIEFVPGINIIVGPNGSGKSNIIDAIHWALGAHAPTELRGSEMRDFLFSGSKNRPPSPYAEVRITFSGMDAIPLLEWGSPSEVEIVRKYTRNGESIYRMNGARVRLREILDFLYQIGWGSYTIIHQDQIQEIPLKSPKELREFLEQSAGLSRFRLRKGECIRKMEEIRKNIVILQEKIHHLTERKEILENEAKELQKYRTLQTEILRLASAIYYAERTRWEQEVQKCSRREKKLYEEIENLEKKVQEITEQEEKLKEEEGIIKGDLSRIQDKILFLQNELFKKKENLASIQAEEEMRKREQEKIEDEEKEEETKRVSQEKRLKELLSLREKISYEGRELKGKENESAEEIRSLEIELSHLLTEREDVAKSLFSLLETETHLKNQIRSLQSVAERENSLLKEEEEELLSAEETLSALQEEEERTHNEETFLVKAIQEKEIEEKKVKEEVERNKKEVFHLEEEEKRLLEEIVRLRNRIHQWENQLLGVPLPPFLQGTVRSPWKDLPLPDQHLSLIETILEHRLTFFLTDQEDFFQTLIKEPLLQRIQILYSPTTEIEENSVRGQNVPQGSWIPLSFLFPEQSLPSWFQKMIFRIYLSPEPFTPPLPPKDPPDGWVELWDFQGVGINRDGIWFLGPLRKEGKAHIQFSLIKGKEELRNIEEQFHKVQKDKEGKRNFLTQSETLLKTVTEELFHLREKMEETQRRKRDNRKDKEYWEERTFNLRKNIEDRRKKLEDIQEEILSWEEKRKNLPQSSFLEKRVKELDVVREEKKKALEMARERYEAIRNQLENLRETEKQIEKEIHYLENSLKEISQRKAKRENEKKSLLKIFQALREEEERILQEISSLEKEIQERNLEMEEKKKNLAEVSTKRDEINQEKISLQENLHSIKEERIRIEEKRKGLEEKLSQGEDTFRSIYRNPPIPSVSLPGTISQWERELQEKEKELTTLGLINHLAEKELEELIRELKQLENGQEDLKNTLSGLEKELQNLEQEGKTIFLNHLQKVQEKVQTVFERLVGEGKFLLSLVEPENWEESGVEIQAIFPGGKKTRLPLLSGGQKALCALTFLFSLFLLHPGPSLLLDEVDSPLDEVNLRRFHNLLLDLRTSTQLILVTHHPLTMELGDQLIGVTTNEDGISQVIPYAIG
jgi:chromosome segregation protein